MKGSFFQRHLVEDAFASAKSWPEQVKLDSGSKPTNAEFEQWTLQLEPEVKSRANVAVNGTEGIVNGGKLIQYEG